MSREKEIEKDFKKLWGKDIEYEYVKPEKRKEGENIAW